MNFSSKDIQTMFATIAPKYDLLNMVLSFGIDRYWRRVAVNELLPQKKSWILDVASGTADTALEIASQFPESIKIFGIDFTYPMLKLGNIKISRKNFQNEISLGQANGEMLPCFNNSFNGVIVAFGIRNFSNLELGLSEIRRVLKPDKKMVILEFSVPKLRIIKLLYMFYFNKILPLIGKIISGHQFAYQYLPNSVVNFPSSEEMTKLIKKTGFNKVKSIPLSFGIATVYTGIKYDNK